LAGQIDMNRQSDLMAAFEEMLHGIQKKKHRKINKSTKKKNQCV